VGGGVGVCGCGGGSGGAASGRVFFFRFFPRPGPNGFYI